jgi:hypothetical protein
MSNLLEQASLVMIPSGYKEDVVYSEIPLDGSGDMSFTRASDGTRINSQGFVETVPWNMLSNSEQFTSANGWFASITGGSTATQTSDYGVAPNGTTTADRIQLALNGQPYADWVSFPTLPIVVGQVYTYSIYMKSLSGTPTIYFFYDGVSSINKTLTTDWVRYEHTFTATNTSIYPRFLLQAGSSSSADLLAWGYQLNIGSTAKPYFPTTDRLNVPRLTYQNGGGGCPSLLLEPQRTNVAYYSNDLATAPNVVDASTTTANVYVSPDGTQNAMRFTETTAVDRHGFYQYTTVTAQTYTASIFTKQTGRRYISFVSDMKGVADAAYFDLQTKTAINVPSGYTCSVEDFGNGWLRLIVTFTASAGSHYVIWGGSPDGSSTTYAGSTSISQTFYGYQLEAGSYATSLINTTSSTATRVADECAKSGISSLIGQSEGSIFFEMYFTQISNAQFRSFFCLEGSVSSQFSAFVVSTTNNGNDISYAGTNYSLTTGRHKVVCTYSQANNQRKLFVDGVLRATSTHTNFLSSIDRVSVGCRVNPFSGFAADRQLSSDSVVSEFAVFNSLLTDAECQSLTTL